MQWRRNSQVFRLNDSNFPIDNFFLLGCFDTGDDDTAAAAAEFVLDGEARGGGDVTCAPFIAFFADGDSDFLCKAEGFGGSMSPDLFFLRNKLGILFRGGDTDLSVTSNPCCMMDPGTGRKGPT
jgi:hypothetical protein